MLVLGLKEACVKLAAACSSAMRFQLESVAVGVREICSGCWLITLCPSTPYPKGTRKNSSWEEEGINELCQLIGQWVTKSFGGGIDSRKEIDLWLLQIFGMTWPGIEPRSSGPLANTQTIKPMSGKVLLCITNNLIKHQSFV